MALTTIGKLWKMKKRDNGEEFLSGIIDGMPVLIFRNKRKFNARSPDFVVMQSDGTGYVDHDDHAGSGNHSGSANHANHAPHRHPLVDDFYSKEQTQP